MKPGTPYDPRLYRRDYKPPRMSAAQWVGQRLRWIAQGVTLGAAALAVGALLYAMLVLILSL